MKLSAARSGLASCRSYIQLNPPQGGIEEPRGRWGQVYFVDIGQVGVKSCKSRKIDGINERVRI